MHKPIPNDLLDDFGMYVLPYMDVGERDACWLWIGHKDLYGYGIIDRRGADKKGKQYRAHRVVYAFNSEKNVTPYVIRHECDNTSCVNPWHLWAGEQKDNVRDMIKRGRHGWGSILDEVDVLAIRKSLYWNVPVKTVAEWFKISEGHVRKIERRERWANI